MSEDTCRIVRVLPDGGVVLRHMDGEREARIEGLEVPRPLPPLSPESRLDQPGNMVMPRGGQQQSFADRVPTSTVSFKQ